MLPFPESMSFEKVRLRTIPAVVAEQIELAIHLGRFPLGSKLPPEDRLADQMGVSRPSVREALSALRTAGLIESRKGSGSYVLKRPGAAAAELGPSRHRTRYIAVVQARAAFEPPAAAMAARHAEEGDVAALNRILEKMRSAAQRREVDDYLEEDQAFHIALARAARNQLVFDAVVHLVKYMGQSLYRVFRRHPYLMNAVDHGEIVDMHKLICDRIAAKDAAGAQEACARLWEQTRGIWDA